MRSKASTFILTAESIAKALGCGGQGCSCGKKIGNGYLTHCPAHDDEKPSLSITEKDGKILFYCHGGCSQERVIDALKERGQWHSSSGPRVRNTKRKMVATYDYVDAEGNLLFQVCRYEPKGFNQRRPDGKGGWIYKMDGVTLVPYRLPKLFEAERVYISEGEEDVKALERLGLTATTNPMGAGTGKWKKEFNSYFQGKHVVILPDNDPPGHKHAQEIARNLHGIAASVKVVELPGLPEKGDVGDWLTNGGTAETLEALVQANPEWEPSARGTESFLTTGPYKIINGVTCHEKDTRDGPITIPLCNFAARIVAEELRDDGAECQTFYALEGTLGDGRPLNRKEVPAQHFSGLNWIPAQWGTRAVVFAGHSTKDHLRAAIQLLSGEVPRRVIFAHLGWRKIEDEWLYLHLGGAIGKNGTTRDIEVFLGDSHLNEYALPDPPCPDELQKAIRTSLTVLLLAPRELTYPLLAAVYRSPLAECSPVDLSIFLAGPTGCQKTELTAMGQAHFGAAFNGRNLPANWATTANALEKVGFLVKDAILTVDDFVPRGTTSEVQRLHRDADRLLRGQANRAGRGRMRADGSLRPEYMPRGLIISSGEDIPQGHSLRARMLILEVKRGDVNLNLLTQAQDNAANGLFAQAMAGYIQWLVPQIDDLKTSLPKRLRELREVARKEKWDHDKTPDNWASLMAGFEKFLQFAQIVGAISKKEEGDLFHQCWEALKKAARAQGTHQASEEPTARFLSLLGAAITSGRAFVTAAKTNDAPEKPHLWGWREKPIGTGDFARKEWQPQGEHIGWVDGDNLLLEPDTVFAVVQRLAKDQGTSLPITQRTLWKRLDEKGLVASKEPSQNRNTVRWTIGGSRKRVIHLKAEVLSPQTGPIGPIGQQPDNHEGLGTETMDRFSGTFQEPVPQNGPEVHDGRGPGPGGPKGPFSGDGQGGIQNTFSLARWRAAQGHRHLFRLWFPGPQRRAAAKLMADLKTATPQACGADEFIMAGEL